MQVVACPVTDGAVLVEGRTDQKYHSSEALLNPGKGVVVVVQTEMMIQTGWAGG